MKRNETVLVYAVTGLLLVILLVAVVFGSQPANAGPTSKTDKTAQLPGVAPALMGGDTTPSKVGSEGVDGEDPEGQGTGGAPTTSGADSVPGLGPAQPTSVEDTPQGPAGPADPSGGQAEPDVVADDGSVTAPLNTRIDLAARRLTQSFGPSERRGDYRLVTAWSGATMHKVVERWCGSTESVDEVLTLNETLGQTLRAGDEVLVPWVDAETLLAADAARRAAAKKIDWAKGEAYKLKKGDSLWKVASRRVAKNQIPAWLERFKTLNPEISDLGALVEGQAVRLPR